MKKLLLLATLLTATLSVSGQMFPERSDTRKGNREYGRENYVEAEAAYMGALSKNPVSYEGNFNLGTAYYRQGRYEEAAQRFQQLGQFPNYPEVMAKTQYNHGNALVQQYKESYDRQKLQEALEVYKQSLRLNPDDREAKFNLAYVQKLLEQDNDGDGGGGEGGDDSNNPDGGDNENDPGQDPNQDPGQGDPDNQNGDNDPQNQENDQNPGREPRMSKEEAEQMLNAMQNSEEGAREKMEGQPVKSAVRSGKNW